MLRKVMDAARRFAGESPKNLVYPFLVTLAAGLALVLIGRLGEGDGHPAKQPTFNGTVDLNVMERGGAPIYDSAGDNARLVGRVQRGHELRFVGFCIGRAERSVSTGLPDERWFMLSSHNVISAADVVGGPPTTFEPSRCAGSRALPQVSGLGARLQRRGLILHVQAPGATLVGFAALEPGDRRWRSLGLAVGHDVYTRSAAWTGAMAVLAVVCWAESIPAYTTGSENYIEELGSLGHASSHLRTAASKTVGRGREAACAPPTAKRPEHPQKRHSKPKPSRIPALPTGPQVSSTTVEVEPIDPQRTTSPAPHPHPEPGETPTESQNNAAPAPPE
jgi:hypothetical protein